jgi:hypothetical protein
LPQRRTGELGQTVVALDRGHVRAQSVPEAAGVVQIRDACLLDRLGEHLADVEVDVPGLGEFQNLTLHIGQPGRRQIVEVDVVDVADRRSHESRLTPNRPAFSRIVPGYAGGNVEVWECPT